MAAKNKGLSGQDAIDFALMAKDIQDINKHLDNMDVAMRNEFVRKAEFEPVRNLVFGFMVFIVLAVLGAWVAFVIVKPGSSNQQAPITTSQSK